MIRLVIIDDSALIRRAISCCFEGVEDISTVGVFPNPVEAIEEIPVLQPDVIICDIEMPKMDGLQFLRTCTSRAWRIPVIICSSKVDKAGMAMQAYSLGAVQVLLKPDMSNPKAREESKGIFRNVVRSAYQIKHSLKYERAKSCMCETVAKPPVIKKVLSSAVVRQVIVLGASTGGPEALKTFFSSLTVPMPPILVVQHMPEGFTKLFADTLDRLSPLTIVEAKGGEVLANNMVYLAPGNRQMCLTKMETTLKICVGEGALVNGHRPSVDYLFNSVAKLVPHMSIAMIFTGMGNDGASGMKALKSAGCPLTIAQDEESCTVFGMPKEAIALNSVDKVLPLKEIASVVMRNVNRRGDL